MTKKPPKKTSGPSGEHKQPRITLRAYEHEFEAWLAAAAGGKLKMDLTNWIRWKLNLAAMLAGFDPVKFITAPTPETKEEFFSRELQEELRRGDKRERDAVVKKLLPKRRRRSG